MLSFYLQPNLFLCYLYFYSPSLWDTDGSSFRDKDLIFFTFSPTLIIFWVFFLFHNGHVADIKWYLIVLLSCILLMIIDLTIFSWTYWPVVYLLWRNIYSRPVPSFGLGFFFLLFVCLSCKNSLYILDVSVSSSVVSNSLWPYEQ